MTPRLPVLNPRKMLQALKKAGFYIHHQSSSHIILKRDCDKKRVTVPNHPCDLHRIIVKSILNQAGLSDDEFSKLL